MRAALFALLAALAIDAAGAEPAVAFVADIRGNASIEGDGPVAFLSEIPAGTHLLLGTGATVAVTFAATGTEFTLSGPGEFTVSATEVRADKGTAPAKRMVQALADPGVVSRAARGATATASTRMRSLPVHVDATKTALEFPVDTAVATLQPNLRWRGPIKIHGYWIVVTDESGREVFKGTATTPMRPTSVLVPDTRYTWTLAEDNVPVGSAQFHTLPAASIERVKRTRPIKSFRDLVIHALVLEEVGATQEAREAWQQVARERPDLAQSLAQRQ
jgi:hypothetical protein